MILFSILLLFLIVNSEANLKSLLNGWTVIGYNPIYDIDYNRIVAHDSLIDIKSCINKSDKSRWYFKSPLIKPKLLSFTLTSYMGRFDKLNDDLKPVVVKIGDNEHVFPHIKFNGTTTKYYVQFISHLWTPPLDTNEPFSIEILGDWTQGNETIGLSDVIEHQRQ